MVKNRHIKERVKNNLKNKADYDALTAQQTGSTTSPVGTPDNPSTRVFTLANVITFTRLIFTLIFLYLFITHENRYIALAFYVTAALTDFLDGQIARRTQTVSWVGKIMDPIMDRVLLFTGVLGLVLTGELPLWTAIFVIGRDAYLGIGAQVLQRYRRRPVDVVFIGKVTTALLMFGFSDLLLGLPLLQGLRLVNISWLPLLNDVPAPLGMLAVYAGIICSVITAIIYTKTGISIIRSARSDQKDSLSHA
ncbi:MAG: CDP-alcohol phosphatidyltransferase family protein [Atopobium sp.]|uniref:CDP-alcohol phosphatidyltransferase family protein n=2 Tax=Atopobiaceae TaxID=1643824 RepID=UPI002A75FA03|nr:CDP-alcohol phosphatidyltransferase family protein [Atopobium sp.]MDY2788230.1 CDP-alcohol phosphatidyltransferase family protein [Atopobium sp.]MDY4522592.1 CDP-alcohol phosphatidyltransferase family protein [Atopobium sp.]